MNRCSAVIVVAALLALVPTRALAHGQEKGVPAITDVQIAIAVLATHPGSFPQSEIADHALDKVKDAQEARDTSGVDLALIRQAQAAIEGGHLDQALTFLERSVGVCPGAPVVDPETAPRVPPALSSPCPATPAHLKGLPRRPLGGSDESILLMLGGAFVLGGITLSRRLN